MASKTYPAPTIPETPSATINSMLDARCNRTFNNPVKYAVAFYICMVFQAITTLYNAINTKKVPSHTFWMIACGIVSVLIMLKSYLVYQILMATAVFLRIILRYGFFALALMGAGLGVSGAVFFDKEGGKRVSSPAAVIRDSMDKVE